MFNSRQRFGLLSTVAVTATLLVGAVSAQALRDSSGPAEFPPSSFTANQYVDSRGCVFVRAGIGGNTEWVPRVSRDRNQLCGFQPTRVAGATSAPRQASAPNPLDTRVAGLAPRAPAAAPTVRPTATPVRAPAPVVRAPVVRAPVVQAPVVRAPTVQAPTVRAPVPTVAPQSNAPRLSVPTSTANAINPLTGLPVGAVSEVRAPVVTASPSPRVITAPQVATIARPTAQPTTQPRLSRVQACADMATSGRRYMSTTTGLPIRCGPQTQAITSGGGFGQLNAGLSRQQPFSNPLDSAPGTTIGGFTGPVVARTGTVQASNPLDAAPGTTGFVPGANTRLGFACNSGTGVNALRCGPQQQSPSGGTRSVATVTRSRTSPIGQELIQDLLGLTLPPYSNPNFAYALPTPTAPRGFVPVWDDGRLNTQRGLPHNRLQTRTPSGMVIRTGPQTQSPSGYSNPVRYAVAPSATAPAAAAQPRTTTRAVAPQPQRAEQISGHRYVQVGSYASRDQAQSIAQSLRSRGLPMRIGVFNQNGREMRMVLAGPFGSDNQLQSALGTARGAGYSGAFTRR